MTVHTLQANMSRGVLTPLAHARVDTDIYRSAIAEGLNVVVSRYGGVTRCPGTTYEGETRYHNKKSRFIPFEFNRSQVYAIEAGDLYFRFWTPNGQVVSGGPPTPYTITTPYLEADLKYIKFRQSGDVVYVFCLGYRPRLLTRISETNWTLTDYTPQDGPYMPINETATTLTPADTGSVTPKMTSLTLPSGVVSTTSGAADAWEIFDRVKSTQATVSAGASGDLTYDLGVGNSAVIDAYWITSGSNNADWDDMPQQWVLYGSNNGTDWTAIDSRDGEKGWAGSETRYFETFNKVAYRYHKMSFSGGGGSDSNNTAVAEVSWHRAASNQTPFNLTASSTTGINDGNGFQTTDVGRPIRLYGSDGRWRWAEIVSRSSSTVVTIRLHGQALPDTSAIVAWRLGAWSDFTGWPAALAIYEDRLVAARTPLDPLGVWFSKNGAYTDFGQSTPLVDDDGISIRLTGGRLDDISWLSESKVLIAGTAGSMRTIGGVDTGKQLSATNIRQRSETIVPAAYLDPVEIENVMLFIDVYQQKLYEAAYNYEADGFLAREVSTANEHLFMPGIIKLAYTTNPHKVIWALRTDGKIVAFTYDRDQQVAGGTLVDVGGVVEDITPLTGALGTDLWMTVQRTVDGSTKRYVERLADFYRDDLSLTGKPTYAACAHYYSGALTDTVSGLGALEGLTVGVWADGRDIGDAVVDSGAITVPKGVEAEEMVIGLRMPWRLKTLRLSQIGNQDGSGLGRQVKIINALLDYFESAGVKVGSQYVTDDHQFEEDAEEDPEAPVPLRTDMYPMPVDDSWGGKGIFVMEGDLMYPVTIRAISLEVDGEP